MSRTGAREVSMMLLYSDSLGGAGTPRGVCAHAEDLKPDALDEEDVAYAEQIVSGVGAEKPRIDALISEYAEGWAIERIARVDLAILRVAIYEMLCREDVPTGAAINEAVELAKRFGGERSYAFINGILGSVAKKLQAETE